MHSRVENKNRGTSSRIFYAKKERPNFRAPGEVWTQLSVVLKIRSPCIEAPEGDKIKPRFRCFPAVNPRQFCRHHLWRLYLKLTGSRRCASATFISYFVCRKRDAKSWRLDTNLASHSQRVCSLTYVASVPQLPVSSAAKNKTPLNLLEIGVNFPKSRLLFDA